MKRLHEMSEEELLSAVKNMVEAFNKEVKLEKGVVIFPIGSTKVCDFSKNYLHNP